MVSGGFGVAGHREAGQQLADLPAIRSMAASSSLAAAVIASSIQAAICGMCSSRRPRVVMAGVPIRIPDGSNGLRGSNGTVL